MFFYLLGQGIRFSFWFSTLTVWRKKTNLTGYCPLTGNLAEPLTGYSMFLLDWMCLVARFIIKWKNPSPCTYCSNFFPPAINMSLPFQFNRKCEWVMVLEDMFWEERTDSYSRVDIILHDIKGQMYSKCQKVDSCSPEGCCHIEGSVSFLLLVSWLFSSSSSGLISLVRGNPCCWVHG